jgi:hypothetical protein
MVWALLRLSAALVGSLTELFCPQRHVGFVSCPPKMCWKNSQEDHRFLRKNTLRRANHLSDVTGRLMVCWRVDRVRLPASTPLAKSSGPQGAAPPSHAPAPWGPLCKSPEAKHSAGTEGPRPDCIRGGRPWLEIDFRQKTPAPPIRFSKAKRREAPTTHGLKREDDNSNLKASNPMAQAGFGFRT